MPLFEFVPADAEAVRGALAQHWPTLTLSALLKQSQNHIYEAHSSSSGSKYAVRVVPDPDGRAYGRVQAEAQFVSFLCSPAQHPSSAHADQGAAPGEAGLLQPRVPGVCSFLPSQDGSLVVCTSGRFILCVCAWAEGQPVDWLAYTWMTDAGIASAWGAWLARLHAASRAYVRSHPSLAAGLRSWDDLHEGLMAGYDTHPEDEALRRETPAGSSGRYIPLHGDVNISNFHLLYPSSPQGEAGQPSLQVFDWDQASWGWIELDIVGAALTPYMLAEAGSVPACEPVPQAHPPHTLLHRLRDAYNAEAVRLDGQQGGAVLIDEDRLQRMLQLRREFYYRFASRALREAEGEQGEGGRPPVPLPPGFEPFLRYTLAWAAAGRQGGGRHSE